MTKIGLISIFLAISSFVIAALRMPRVEAGKKEFSSIDGKDIPVPHYGVILKMNEWEELARRLVAAKVSFIVEPHIRFPGKAGEQGTMFISDPGGNVLEFKGFRHLDQLFVAE